MSTRGRSGAWLAALAALPLLVLGVFFVLPVAGMVGRGFFSDGSFDPGAVVEVLGRGRVQRVLWFTVWSAGLATARDRAARRAGGVRPAPPRASRARRLLRAFLLVPFVMPTVVVGVAFRTLLAPSGPLGALRLDGTATAIVAAMVFFNLAVVVRTVGSLWEGLDRRREEAAAALGASPMQVFRTVTLPALMPGIVSAASVVFLFCATSFGVVLTLGGLRYATVETEIYLLTTQFLDLRAASALSVLQLVVVSVLLYGAQRTRTAREHALDRAAQRDAARRPRRGDAAVLVTTGLTLAVRGRAAVGPRASGRCAVDGAWTPAELPRPRHDRRRRAAGARSSEALANSWRVAVDATAAGPAARRARRGSGRRVPPSRAGTPCARHARRGVHAAARCLRGDPRLRVPGHPRPAAARPAQLRRCSCRSRRPWSRCPWWCARSRRCSARSTPASGRPPRRSAPRRCRCCSPSTCPWSGDRCSPPPGSRSRSRSASSGRPASSPVRTGRPCRW